MEDETLTPVRSDLLATGWSALVAAAVVVAGGIAALGWGAVAGVAGTLVGAAVFGVGRLHWDLRDRLPRGDVPDAPLSAQTAEEERWSRSWSAPFLGLVMLPLAAGATRFMGGETETAAFAIPGLPAGIGAGSLVAAALVARWSAGPASCS